MTLDIKTLILLNFIVNLVNACVLAIIWRQYRKHFKGLLLLFVDMILQTLGFFLILMRGTIPDFISIVISNVFFILGALLVLIGFEYFFDKKSKHIHNIILLAVFLCIITYFSLVNPDLTIREICVSVMIILINAQSCRLLFRRVGSSLRQIAKIPGFTLLAYILVSLLRIIFLVVFPVQTSEFFKSGLVDSIAIAIYLTLSILITISLILLVSRRLLVEVQTEKEKYNTTFNSSPYAIILTRLSDGKIFEVNKGFVRITGYNPSEVIGKTTLEVNLWVREEDRLLVVNELSTGNEVRELEVQFRNKSGYIITGLLSSNFIMANDEECILTSVSDITETSQMKKKLHDMAMHDSLTGLPNRILFNDRFNIAIANAQREKKKVAIMSMDLDLIKEINDTLGHDAGDQVLVIVSNRVASKLRKMDTVARFGGDEFVLLLWDISQRSDVVVIATKIQDCLSQPIKIGDHVIKITASLGISIYPEDGIEINILVKKSDQAMYYVKANGRGNYQFYDTSLF